VSSPRYHHGNLRSALLEQAERTLELRGTQALSLRELAREVGVSHAAPRRHFPDRQALLDALAIHGFARLRAGLEEAAGTAGPFGARLHALAQTYVSFSLSHAALLELMYAGKQRVGAQLVREAAELTFAVPLAVIVEAQSAGELPGGDPQQVATLVFATLQGLATLAGGGMLPAAPVDEVVRRSVEQLIDGLRPHAVESRRS